MQASPVNRVKRHLTHQNSLWPGTATRSRQAQVLTCRTRPATTLGSGQVTGCTGPPLYRPSTVTRNLLSCRCGRPDSAYAPPRSTTQALSSQPVEPVTYQEVVGIAMRRGLTISLQRIGPLFKITCRDDTASGELLGMTDGFTLPPLGFMHCDKLQVFTKRRRGEDAERVRGGFFGLGLLLGAATFSYGLSQGCTKAEILAINDEDRMHRRLVTYYKWFGFKTIVEVGGRGLADLPHQLVWGGVGTRMDADMADTLQRWSSAIRRL